MIVSLKVIKAMAVGFQPRSIKDAEAIVIYINI